jgi:CcmD family protein
MRVIRTAIFAFALIFFPHGSIEVLTQGVTHPGGPFVCAYAQEYRNQGRPAQPIQKQADDRRTVLYTVAAVILVVWVGIALFLWRLDKKITRLEKNLNEIRK